MYGILKRTISAVLMICLILIPAVCVRAEVDPSLTEFGIESDAWGDRSPGPAISAQTACVIDADTGTVLYAKGMDVQRFPASITKVMTAIIVLENSDLNALVGMDGNGLADAYAGSSNINPSMGEIFTVEQLLQMTLVKSANDCATQLAVVIGGSVEGFANMMNEKAAALGCTNTHFANANGLEDPQNYTSAHDVALIMQEALKFDKFREIISMQTLVIPATNMNGPRQYDTHIQMIIEASPYYYPGCLGGKTGYTDEARDCLTVAATRDGRTLVGVVLSDTDSVVAIYDMSAILDYGFATMNELYPPVEEQTVEASADRPSSGSTERKYTPDSSDQEAPRNTTETSAAAVSEVPEKTGSADVMLIILIILIAVIALLIFVGIRTSVTNRRRRRK